jgi:ribosomal protein S18 acetylase RimI-like enzyme
MTLSRQPSVMSLRYMFRSLGLKSVTVVQFERSLLSLPDRTSPDELAFVLLNESNLPALLDQGLLPDHGFMSLEARFLSGHHQERRRNAVKEVRDRLARGDLCIVGMVGGRAVGWAWTSCRDQKYEWAVETTLRFDPRSCLIYDVQVYPQNQRKGYASALCYHALTILASQGATKAYAVVEEDNDGSKRTFMGLGFQPTKAIRRTRVFRLSSMSERSIQDPPME